MTAVATKRCTKCGETQPLSSFHKYRLAADGLQFHCRECQHRAYVIRYEKKKEHILAINAAYRLANPEKVATRKAKYFQAHKDNYNRDLRAWRKKHWQHHYINHLEKRRALIRGATVSDFTKSEWLEILKDHGYLCTYCGSTSKLTMDHIVPLSKGGAHTKQNITPACRPCNSRKRDALL